MPVRGVSNSRSFIDTPGDLCPYALDADGLPIMRNVVPFTPSSKDRGVMGQRAGVVQLFPQQCGGPGGSPWQAIIPVARASVIDGYRPDVCDPLIDGISAVSGALAGNFGVIDSVPSSDYFSDLDVSDDGGGTANAVQATACCPVALTNDDDMTYYLYAVASNYTSGVGRARVQVRRSDTHAVVWTYNIATDGEDRFVNTMCCSDNFLFVCTNAIVLMLRITDGSLAHTETLRGWSQEAVQAAVYKTVAGAEYLFVGFNGSEVAGATSGNGTTITAGIYASCFRAGVMRFVINNEYVSPIGPYENADALTFPTTGWGQTIDLDTGDVNNEDITLYDSFHGYFRISEWSQVTGHGCLITGLAVNRDNGNVFVFRTNQGWGPNASYPPDGETYPNITVMGISFAGVLLWEADTNSITEVGDGGYTNDIPIGAGDDPSISAGSCNARGELCVGGRANDAGFSIFGINARTGTLQWQANVQDAGSVRQGAIDYDRGDGHFTIGGDRNDAWDGASPGDDRNLWVVHSQTGEVLDTFDWEANVSVLSVAKMPDGGTVVGTDRI